MLRSLLVLAGGAASSLGRARVALATGEPRLSLRQRQVLDGYARGRLTKQIAADLGIKESTVKTHLAKATAALGAHTRAEAIARYVSWTRRRERRPR